jgi:serine/threonine-protein kinase
VEPGRVIEGRFVIERKLGSGSMSEVWLANDGQRKVALKFADSESSDVSFERAIQCLASEAKVLGQLQHPGVPYLVSSALDVAEPYLVMEYIDGANLEQEIGRRSKNTEHFPLERLSRLVEDIAATLDYAHSLRIVHRDLKPSNIMLLVRGERLYPKILDFGVAKRLDADSFESTTAGRVIGTPLYLSPEQIMTDPISERTDVFALAVLTFEMLSLRRAWLRGDDHKHLPSWHPVLSSVRNSKEQVLYRIGHGPRPSICELRPELPRELDRVLARGLSVDPTSRHDSPEELWSDLARALFDANPREGSIPARARPTKPM